MAVANEIGQRAYQEALAGFTQGSPEALGDVNRAVNTASQVQFTEPQGPQTADYLRVAASQPIDPNLPESVQARIRGGREDVFARLRQDPATMGFVDKFKSEWKSGGISSKLDRAIARASDKDDPESRAAVQGLIGLQDQFNAAQGINPIERDNLVEKMAFDAAQSGSEMANLLGRELALDVGLLAGGLALSQLEPTPAGEIATVAATGGRIVRTGSAIKNVLAGVGAASRGASRFARGAKALDAANDARRIWGKAGLTGNALETAVRGSRSIAGVARTMTALNPTMRQGEGQIYSELIRQEIDPRLAKQSSRIGGMLYGAIEGFAGPADLLAGTGVTKVARKAFGEAIAKGTLGGLKKAGTRLGASVLAEWSEEGAQSLVTGTAESVAQRRQIEAYILDGMEDEIKKLEVLDGGEIIGNAWKDMKGSFWGVLGLTLPLGVGGSVIGGDVRNARAVKALEEQLKEQGVTPTGTEERGALEDKAAIVKRGIEAGATPEQVQEIYEAEDGATVVEQLETAKGEETAAKEAEAAQEQQVADEAYKTALDETIPNPADIVEMIDAEDSGLQVLMDEQEVDQARIIDDTIDRVEDTETVEGEESPAIQMLRAANVDAEQLNYQTEKDINAATKQLAKIIGAKPASRVAELAKAEIEGTRSQKRLVSNLAKAMVEGELTDAQQRRYEANREAVDAEVGILKDKAFEGVHEDLRTTLESIDALPATKKDLKARKDEVSMIQKVAKALGVDVMFAKDSGASFYSPSTNTIVIDSEVDEPMLSIFGHELSHDIETKDPDTAQRLTDYLNAHHPDLVTDALEKYEALNPEHFAELSEEERTSEARATVIERAFASPEFWADAKENMPESLFQKVVAYAKELYESFTTTALQSAQVPQDVLDKVRETVFGTEAVAEEVAAEPIGEPSVLAGVPFRPSPRTPRQIEGEQATQGVIDSGTIESGTYADDLDDLAASRTDMAKGVDVKDGLSSDPTVALKQVIGGVEKSSRVVNPMKALADKYMPQFLTNSSMLNTISSGLANMYATGATAAQKKAYAFWNQYSDYFKDKRVKEIAKAANLNGVSKITDANGAVIPNWKRRHTGTMYGYSRHSFLPELIEAADNGDVERTIDVIAARETTTPEEAQTFKRQLTQLSVAWMAETEGTETSEDGSTRPKIKRVDGKIQYSPDRKFSWEFGEKPFTIKSLEQAESVVLSARKMNEIAESTPVEVKRYVDDVYFPIADGLMYNTLKGEFEIRNPNEAFHKPNKFHMPLLRKYAGASRSQQAITAAENDEAAKYAGLRQDSTVKDMLLSNMRATKERQIAVSDMVLYGIDEISLKQAKDIQRYHYGTFATNWKAAINASSEEIRNIYGDEFEKNLQRGIANVEGVIDDSHGPISKVINNLLSRHSGIILQNPWTWVYQPISLVSFTDIMDDKHVKKAIKAKISREGRDDIANVLKHAPYLKARRSQNRVERHYAEDSGLAAQQGDLQGTRGEGIVGAFGKLNTFLSKGMTKADTQAVDVGILSALYQIKEENPNMPAEEQYRLAANLATYATNQTQVSSEAPFMSNIRQSKGAIERVVSYMSGATSSAFNFGYRRWRDWEHARLSGDTEAQRAAMRKMLYAGRSLAMQAALIGSVKFLRDAANEPEDEENKKKGKNAVRLSLYSADAAMGYLPGAGPIAPIFLSQAAKRLGDKSAEKRYGFRVGKSPYAQVIGPFSRIGTAMSQFERVTSGDVTGRQAEITADAAKRNFLLGFQKAVDVHVIGSNTTGIMRNLLLPARKFLGVESPYARQFKEKK